MARSIVPMLLLLVSARVAPGDFVINFESPLYAAGSDIDGVDGWRVAPPTPKGTTDAPSGAITPASKSGYPQVLEGKHSFAIFANGRSYLRRFDPGTKLEDGCILSWRIWMEVAQGQVGVYLGHPLDKGGTPIGVEARMAEGRFVLIGAVNEPADGVEALPGREYLIEMVLDFSRGTAEGFITDLAGDQVRKPLGTQSMHGGGRDPQVVAREGGIILSKSGTVAIVDEFRIRPAPAR